MKHTPHIQEGLDILYDSILDHMREKYNADISIISMTDMDNTKTYWLYINNSPSIKLGTNISRWKRLYNSIKPIKEYYYSPYMKLYRTVIDFWKEYRVLSYLSNINCNNNNNTTTKI